MSVRENWEMECPQCHDDSQIDVTAWIDVRLTPDGTDADEANSGDHEWDGGSPCCCVACGFSGRVSDFAVKGSLWVLLTLKDGFEINGVLAASELLGQNFQHHITIQLRPRIYFSVRRSDLERVEVLTVIAPEIGGIQ